MSESNNDISARLKYIYGEDLLGPDGQPKQWPVEIEKVVDDEFPDQRTGKKEQGFSLVFKGKRRMLGITGATITRQLKIAAGTSKRDEMPGKKITLYPVQSKKSISGWAVRIDIGGAQ
jgi:hypothetical protein